MTFAADVEPGSPLRLVKYVAYGWSGGRSADALQDQVAAALASARKGGWEKLLSEQRTYLDRFWEGADIEIDGDEELQQAARFALFHILQAGARGEQRPIAAKGLTGPGYNGHAFWDTETYVLPVLTYTAPRPPATRSPGATARWRPRVSERECSAFAVPASRGGRSPERSAPATGRPEPPPSTSTPTSPTPRRATCGSAGTTTSRPRWDSSCWSKPPGCGARSGTSTATVPSASTASRAPTSTAPSPTTTSTRT